MVLVNVILATLNLLPIPPLDGYHILMVFLPYNIASAIRPMERFGFFILFALLWLGPLDFYFGAILDSVFAVQMFLLKFMVGG